MTTEEAVRRKPPSVPTNGTLTGSIRADHAVTESNGAATKLRDGSEAGGAAASPETSPTDGAEASRDYPTDGHKPPHQKPHHHSGEIKDAIAKEKQWLKDKTKPPGGFDSTPLPDAPPGYTVRFVFHRAANLPAADLSTRSSDPFIHVTLKAPVPRRHKEEPDLTFRTPTRRATTEPVWEQEWIVANVPSAGFTLKCRLYDEDFPDSDDRLGNVTVKVNSVTQDWEGIPPPGREFKAKKRMGSKRAYFFKAITSHFNPRVDMAPSLWVSMELLGRSAPPYAQMHTAGPSYYFKHFSTTIGRITGTKVNRDDGNGQQSDLLEHADGNNRNMQKYDFQSNEMQLCGAVPPELYHRFVEFRQSIGLMFASRGVRGRIMNKVLHKQHRRIYNFSSSTEHGCFAPCSKESSIQFLKLAHFDEGGRLFTYVITLDGMFRFTETGSEFRIDMLSKHNMHSDVATYIACSGEFFIRRLERPDASAETEPHESTHPGEEEVPGGPPREPPPDNPGYYQLIIDNDSGTYRPDKSILPKLKEYLEYNFPGLGIIALHWEDEKLQKLKKAQAQVKKNEGRRVNMVLNRSPSASSMSSLSSEASDLDDLGAEHDRYPTTATKTKKEQALEMMADPKKAKDMLAGQQKGEGSGLS